MGCWNPVVLQLAILMGPIRVGGAARLLPAYVFWAPPTSAIGVVLAGSSGFVANPRCIALLRRVWETIAVYCRRFWGTLRDSTNCPQRPHSFPMSIVEAAYLDCGSCEHCRGLEWTPPTPFGKAGLLLSPPPPLASSKRALCKAGEFTEGSGGHILTSTCKCHPNPCN